jgi:hypothetical protein
MGMVDGHFTPIRQRYPRAYERWTAEEDALLGRKCKEGVGLKELAAFFQRKPSAIASRLSKLSFAPAKQDLNRGSIEAKVAFEWVAVLQAENEEYIFPNRITEFMRRHYSRPAIYRWIIARTGADDETLVYIGEASRLCPDRLSGYLDPGPAQQTNIRLSRQFHECAAQGSQVKLEILNLTGGLLNDLALSENDLKRQDVRRLVERLLVTLYRNRGVNLLNL